MKTQRPPAIVWMIFLLLTILAFTGCSNLPALVRKVTYPPDFKYVSTDELRSRMSQMAFQLQLLDHALEESNIGQPDQQQNVLSALRNIERIGSSLQAGEEGSNHPFLQDYMNDFVNDVGQARSAASLIPPSYYYAGRIAGGCVNCHKVNR